MLKNAIAGDKKTSNEAAVDEMDIGKPVCGGEMVFNGR